MLRTVAAKLVDAGWHALTICSLCGVLSFIVVGRALTAAEDWIELNKLKNV